MTVLMRSNRGDIPPQEAEVITLWNGAVADVRRVRPVPRHRNWLQRLLGRRPQEFVIGLAEDASIPVEATMLLGRDRFCLIDGRSDRPRLNLLPGMRGEITVGASSLSAEQMLRDPGLRRAEGDSSYPLPNGARARIRCGGLTFLIRCIAPGTSPGQPATA